jgi:hypothetical protein
MLAVVPLLVKYKKISLVSAKRKPLGACSEQSIFFLQSKNLVAPERPVPELVGTFACGTLRSDEVPIPSSLFDERGEG